MVVGPAARAVTHLAVDRDYQGRLFPLALVEAATGGVRLRAPSHELGHGAPGRVHQGGWVGGTGRGEGCRAVCPLEAGSKDDQAGVVEPATQEFSAHHELINGIGVAPDYYIPLTAQDLSTGHDPDIAKALTLRDGRCRAGR